MFAGRLIYLMGPSGAGKDSLIAHIKLKNELPLLLPSRYITRTVNAAELEQHQFMTPEAVAAAERSEKGIIHRHRPPCASSCPSIRPQAPPARQTPCG